MSFKIIAAIALAAAIVFGLVIYSVNRDTERHRAQLLRQARETGSQHIPAPRASRLGGPKRISLDVGFTKNPRSGNWAAPFN